MVFIIGFNVENNEAILNLFLKNSTADVQLLINIVVTRVWDKCIFVVVKEAHSQSWKWNTRSNLCLKDLLSMLRIEYTSLFF